MPSTTSTTQHEEENGDWREYRRLVMKAIDTGDAAIKDVRRDLQRLDRRLQNLDKRVDKLSTKSSLFGTIGGSLTMLAVHLWNKLTGK